MNRSDGSSSEPPRVLAGKCRCGAVRYDVSDEFVLMQRTVTARMSSCHGLGLRCSRESAKKLTVTKGLGELAVVERKGSTTRAAGRADPFSSRW